MRTAMSPAARMSASAASQPALRRTQAPAREQQHRAAVGSRRLARGEALERGLGGLEVARGRSAP